jgi:hypothetical protein
MHDKKYIIDNKRRLKLRKFLIIVFLVTSLFFLTACSESYDLKELETTLIQKDWDVSLFEDKEYIDLKFAIYPSIEEKPVSILYAIYGDEMGIVVGDFYIGFI